MSNRYLCHPDGHDDNGGGYDLLGSAGYSDCHSSFGPVANRTGCTITNNGSGKIRIEDEGAFSSDMSGVIVNCTFSDGDTTYTCGRYVIIDASSTYIDIDVAYTSATPTVDVRVGGAILSPDEAADLAYGTDGDELVFPANQTTQTENEVDGSANAINCVTEGMTLDAYGVDEDTGVKLTTDDSTKWPVIEAKDSSTWSASTALLYMQSGSGDDSVVTTTCKLDKLIFDGNDLVPRVVQFGDNASDVVSLCGGDIEVKNSKSDGYGIYSICYIYRKNTTNTLVTQMLGINSIRISDCYRGCYWGDRGTPIVRGYLWCDNCTQGYYGATSICYGTEFVNSMIFTNNTYGMYITERFCLDFITRMTFADNQTDIYIKYYDTNSRVIYLQNCLFYNDNSGGHCIESDNGATTVVSLANCVYGATGSGGSAFDGVSPTETDCEEITADPFVDKDNDDYRLAPDFADLDKIWDWDKQTNCIGATTPAQPESGGGGVSQLINGGFIKCS